MNGCSLGHDYVYWPMLTAPGATQPPCPCCKLLTQLVATEATLMAAESKVLELEGVIDTMQAKIDDARINA